MAEMSLKQTDLSTMCERHWWVMVMRKRTFTRGVSWSMSYFVAIVVCYAALQQLSRNQCVFGEAFSSPAEISEEILNILWNFHHMSLLRLRWEQDFV